MSKHPIQPIVEDSEGVLRFKENKLVTYLLDRGAVDLNQLGTIAASNEDWEQLYQLTGISVSGFGSRSQVSDEAYNAAVKMHEQGMSEEAARIKSLEAQLDSMKKAFQQQLGAIKEGLRLAAEAGFDVDEDCIW